MSAIEREIGTQPADWRRAAEVAARHAAVLPAPGERVVAIGCGTSLHMAQAYAAARESRGQGETDAYPASEYPAGRSYDRLVVISRSGTTTELVRLMDALEGDVQVLVVTGVRDSPVAQRATAAVVLDFADEQSVVQTRFATTALALLLAGMGADLEAEARAAEAALSSDLPDGLERFARFAFLGSGWTVGLASEAALKLREAAGAWSEAYPAMEYRHGPISANSAGTLVWPIGPVDAGVLEDAARAGSTVARDGTRPLAALVLAQRAAVALARSRHLDPDHPHSLTRSVVLP